MGVGLHCGVRRTHAAAPLRRLHAGLIGGRTDSATVYFLLNIASKCDQGNDFAVGRAKERRAPELRGCDLVGLRHRIEAALRQLGVDAIAHAIRGTDPWRVNEGTGKTYGLPVLTRDGPRWIRTGTRPISARWWMPPHRRGIRV